MHLVHFALLCDIHVQLSAPSSYSTTEALQQVQSYSFPPYTTSSARIVFRFSRTAVFTKNRHGCLILDSGLWTLDFGHITDIPSRSRSGTEYVLHESLSYPHSQALLNTASCRQYSLYCIALRNTLFIAGSQVSTC